MMMSVTIGGVPRLMDVDLDNEIDQETLDNLDSDLIRTVDRDIKSARKALLARRPKECLSILDYTLDNLEEILMER